MHIQFSTLKKIEIALLGTITADYMRKLECAILQFQAKGSKQDFKDNARAMCPLLDKSLHCCQLHEPHTILPRTECLCLRG